MAEYLKSKSTGGVYQVGNTKQMGHTVTAEAGSIDHSFSQQAGAGFKRNEDSRERKLACQRLPPFSEADSVPPFVSVSSPMTRHR